MHQVKIIKKLSLLIPIIVVFGLLELGGRLYEFLQPSQSLHSQSIDFDGGFSAQSRIFTMDTENPSLMVTQPHKLQAFRYQKFPKVPKEGTLRIVALGESSVNYLQPEFDRIKEALKPCLGKRFRDVEIINAGGLSYGSQRLTIVAREMLEYKPHVLMIYMGHNEFEEVEQLQLISPQWSGLLKILHHSAIVRLGTEKILAIGVRRLEAEHRARLLSNKPDVTQSWLQYKFTEHDVELKMKAFHDNLEGIIQMYQAKNIQILLGTVPSNLLSPLLPAEYLQRYEPVEKLLNENRFDEAADLARDILKKALGRHQSSDLENEIIRDISRDYNITLVDVEKKIIEAEPDHIPGETLFSDHCHLTAQGNRILADAYLTEMISSSFLAKLH